MEQKKPTNAQLQKRIQNAVVFVPKVKDTTSIYFSDKGLRLTVTDPEDFDGYAVIETGYHRHVFNELNLNGGDGIFNPIDNKWVELPYSRPWIYTKRIIEIANENDCATESGYSYQRLLEVLKAKEDKAEYNIAVYYEWWCMIIFDGLYTIHENEINSWFVYFKYINTLAINQILLEEHTEDLTNKDFVKRFNALISEFTETIDERVLFPKKTDEERVKEEIEAIQQTENDQAMEAQMDGSKD